MQSTDACISFLVSSFQFFVCFASSLSYRDGLFGVVLVRQALMESGGAGMVTADNTKFTSMGTNDEVIDLQTVTACIVSSVPWNVHCLLVVYVTYDDAHGWSVTLFCPRQRAAFFYSVCFNRSSFGCTTTGTVVSHIAEVICHSD